MQWPVSFHRDDAVGDHEVRPNCRANIENATLDTLPMEDILWPSIHDARHHTEHVLHRQRHTGPVVRLYLWHGHDQIGIQDGFREPERFQRGIRARGFDLHDVIAIEIDKLYAPISQM